MPQWSVYYLQLYRNSLGDIATPEYPFWSLTESTASRTANTFYLIIWILFVLYILVMNIVQLNFLIAIISQSYDRIMAVEKIQVYEDRAELNLEYQIISKAFIGQRPFDLMIVMASTTSDNSREKTEWGGYVRSIKTFIKSKQ